MPIDRARKLLFVHIPKTAGTSVEEFLGLRGPWQNEDINTCFGLIQSLSLLEEGFRSNFLQHLTLAELSRLLGSDLQGCTPFAVVRDPWTRIISSFRRKDPDLCHLIRSSCGRDAKEFDLEAYIELAGCLDHAHLRPQHRFLTLAGSDRIDPRIHLFRQEQLVDLEEWLAQRLGESVVLPKSNVSVPQTPWSDLNAHQEDKLRERVRVLYAEDYAAFGYG